MQLSGSPRHLPCQAGCFISHQSKPCDLVTLVHMAFLISSPGQPEWPGKLVNRQILRHLSHLTTLVNTWMVSWGKKIIHHQSDCEVRSGVLWKWVLLLPLPSVCFHAWIELTVQSLGVSRELTWVPGRWNSLASVAEVTPLWIRGNPFG